MVEELGIGSMVTALSGEVRAACASTTSSSTHRRDTSSGPNSMTVRASTVLAAQSDIALRVGEVLKASVTLDERARRQAPHVIGGGVRTLHPVENPSRQDD